MNYRRVLLIAELEDDPGAAIAAIGRVAPDAEHLVVVARLPARAFAWLSSEAPPEFNDATEAALDRLRVAVGRTAHTVDVEPTSVFAADRLTAIVTTSAIDVVVASVQPLRTVPLLAELRKRTSVPVLWTHPGPTIASHDAGTRLLCVARMRGDGFPIVGIVYRGPHQPSTTGFAAVRADEIAALAAPSRSAPANPTSVSTRLDMTTASETISGNRIEVELDNEKARGWLLSSIEASWQRVHLQVYMALDDDVGRPVEAALAAAGARGVTVRVLVDSLHGLHGSLGAHNPILDRLSSRPGVELRVSKPIKGPASLEDLKQRDHRKLVVVDGHVALLGGRNLSHEYYTGFGEVHLTPGTTWRVVPWLDAGARVEGPAVAALDRSFLQAWTDAGGAPFDIWHAAPVGTRQRVSWCTAGSGMRTPSRPIWR